MIMKTGKSQYLLTFVSVIALILSLYASYQLHDFLSDRQAACSLKTKDVIDEGAVSVVPTKSVPLQIVKACFGDVYRTVIDENGEDQLEKTPKTILFFTTPLGAPEIITAKIIHPSPSSPETYQVSTLEFRDANRLTVDEYHHLFEHGRLDHLREQDRQTGQEKYQHLLQEAAELCTGPHQSVLQFEIDSSRLVEEIEKSATAYLSAELELKGPESKILVYYKINGEIFQTEFRTQSFPL